MTILFDEEEIIIEDEVAQEEPYEIPMLQPLKERRVEPVQRESEPVVQTRQVEASAPAPVAPELETPAVTPVVDKPKSKMIDADGPRVKVEPAKELYFPQKDTKTPYQPVDIISPIYGGPKRDAEALKPVPRPVSSPRTPMTQVISPMYGQVETKSSLGDIEPEMLDLDVVDMNSAQDTGLEFQASLYDMIEGLEDEE